MSLAEAPAESTEQSDAPAAEEPKQEESGILFTN